MFYLPRLERGHHILKHLPLKLPLLKARPPDVPLEILQRTGLAVLAGERVDVRHDRLDDRHSPRARGGDLAQPLLVRRRRGQIRRDHLAQGLDVGLTLLRIEVGLEVGLDVVPFVVCEAEDTKINNCLTKKMQKEDTQHKIYMMM